MIPKSYDDNKLYYYTALYSFIKTFDFFSEWRSDLMMFLY